MKRRFITADPHFGHRLLTRLRGFETVEEHDDFLVNRFNEVLSKNSTLIILGDASMSLKGLEPLSRLKGRLELIAGNHDQVWHRRGKSRDIRKALRMVPKYSEYFHDIYTSGVVATEVNGQKVILSHLPVEGDHQKTDRYHDRRPLQGDLPVLSGHVHDAWRIKGRQLNVGVDVNDFLPLKLIDAVQEAVKLTGLGAGERQLLTGPWNNFGLG